MRQVSTARFPAIALALLLISACATQTGVGLPDLPDWDTRTRVLGDMNDWEFKGRIGVSAGGDGFNGKLRYAQNDDAFRATVSGPLGFGTVRIEGDSRQVTVTDKDGAVWVLSDPEVDLQVMYGWMIPVTSLRYWALGIPDPADLAFTEFNEDGLLETLDQGNWQVGITKYRDVAGQSMPRAMSVVSGDNKVRLVIDNWTFR
jgi:outer membrane lipoprotein LolB